MKNVRLVFRDKGSTLQILNKAEHKCIQGSFTTSTARASGSYINIDPT